MITDKMLSNYHDLQENNNHGELLEVIASDLKLNRIKQVFHSINAIHNIEGYLLDDLKQVRDRYRGYLRDYITTNLSEHQSSVLLQYV